MQESLKRVQESIAHIKDYSAGMSAFTLYGEVCSVCGAYAAIANDFDADHDPDYVQVRQMMVDLFGEDRVKAIEISENQMPISMNVSIEASEYVNDFIKTRESVESTEPFKILSGVMRDSAYIASQKRMVDIGILNSDIVVNQMKGLLDRYVEIYGDQETEGLESMKKLTRGQMVNLFGEDKISDLEIICDKCVAGDMDTEGYAASVKDIANAYVVGESVSEESQEEKLVEQHEADTAGVEQQEESTVEVTQTEVEDDVVPDFDTESVMNENQDDAAVEGDVADETGVETEAVNVQSESETEPKSEPKKVPQDIQDMYDAYHENRMDEGEYQP